MKRQCQILDLGCVLSALMRLRQINVMILVGKNQLIIRVFTSTER